MEIKTYTASAYASETENLISTVERNRKDLEDELTNLRLNNQREIAGCNNNIDRVREALLRALDIIDKLNNITDGHRRLIGKLEKRWKIIPIIFSIATAIDIVAIAVLFIHLIN